ncbi:MAG: saccharopine dehydrogenase NADP-binding domain-containing protein [Gammaproteobacteria bacterium]|nr:saccharopine dehydrogenase NADP-binding domain-containing protein [Gammaproteobacteria bacterium]
MAKQNVLVLGVGKIGSLITCLLSESGDYHVHLGNLKLKAAEALVSQLKLQNIAISKIDAQKRDELETLFAQHRFDAVISSLPYYCNPLVADIAAKYQVNYFDLTEDVAVTEHVKQVSKDQNTVFMPQCGLAPGFISIAANALIRHFEKLDTVKMRVGALPVNQNNALKYSLTWSTDGLINEYGNTCYGIENGILTALLPLEGLESITLDGTHYEAFNTSGGLGTLADTYAGKVNSMNYKTVRYPGHCEIIKLLMNDLKLNDDRPTLKRILENAIPKTLQDVVLIYVAVTGYRQGDLFEENYVKKIYPATIAGKKWSSIQVTTAAGLCGVVDIVLNNRSQYKGFVAQENIALDEFLKNRFGKYYA